MDFLTLKIRNFLAIGEANLSLDNKGLVLLQGENQDDTSATSNGVGKSSIADALCWAVYGETARGTSGDAVVNKIAKKNCCVTVRIQDGATTYEVSRYRKDKEFKNSTRVSAHSGLREDGPLGVDLTKGTEKETQEVINGIIGCSIDVFMAAIYAGQDVTPDLPKMTDKQLKLLIEEAAGVERLEGAYEIARSKLNTAKGRYALATSIAQATATSLEGAEKSLVAQKANFDAFELGRAGRAEAFKAEAEKIRAELLRIGGEIKTRDEAAAKARLEVIEGELSEHGKKLARREELRKGKAEADRHHDRALLDLDRLGNDAKKIKASIDNAATEILKPCVTCGKVGSDESDVEKFRVHATAKLREKLTEVSSQKQKVLEAGAGVSKWLDALVEFEKTIPDSSELNAERRALTTVISGIAGLKNDFAMGKKEFDKLNGQADSELTAPNPYASSVTMVEGNLEKLRNTLAVQDKETGLASDDVQIFENVVRVFGPAGVRAHILDTVTPFLNDRTSDYLSALSDGNISAVWTTLSETAKGDLKEKFNIEVSNDKGAESFLGLSGGEKRKVRISTMLALQDLVSSRATKPINIMIADEIDDALDVAGLERLMGVLERKARERGTMLVISHNSLRDWIDSVAVVVKSAGVSSVSGALCL